MEENNMGENDVIQNFDAAIQARREFYKRNRQILLCHLIGDIPVRILRHIAVMCHNIALFPNDWKELAYFMGIQNNMEVATIDAAAVAAKEMPLFIAMHDVLNSKSYVQIIDAFLNLQRDDILSYLEPYTISLLSLHNAD